MAAKLIEIDPAAGAPARALGIPSRRPDRDRRESLAITAYATGDFALALRELRTYRRISGSDDQIALMVDSERGVGRPDRALEVGRAVDKTIAADRRSRGARHRHVRRAARPRPAGAGAARTGDPRTRPRQRLRVEPRRCSPRGRPCSRSSVARTRRRSGTARARSPPTRSTRRAGWRPRDVVVERSRSGSTTTDDVDEPLQMRRRARHDRGQRRAASIRRIHSAEDAETESARTI